MRPCANHHMCISRRRCITHSITLIRVLVSSQIWEKTKVFVPAPGEGLTREQFSVALRLIAAAQVMHNHELSHMAQPHDMWKHLDALTATAHNSTSYLQHCIAVSCSHAGKHTATWLTISAVQNLASLLLSACQTAVHSSSQSSAASSCTTHHLSSLVYDQASRCLNAERCSLSFLYFSMTHLFPAARSAGRQHSHTWSAGAGGRPAAMAPNVWRPPCRSQTAVFERSAGQQATGLWPTASHATAATPTAAAVDGIIRLFEFARSADV